MAYETELTPKQLAFAKGVINGLTGSDAARAAGCKGNAAQVGERAKLWMRVSKVRAYIEAEKARIASALKEEDILTKKEMLLALGRIVKRQGKDARASSRDVTGAIAQASKMLGCDAPSRVEVKLEGSLLHRIRSRRS
jgi:phage terminase small subunit